MKKLIVLCVVFIIFSYSSKDGAAFRNNAKDTVDKELVYQLPDYILEKIKKRLKDSNRVCDNQSEIFSDRFYELENQKLLVFLGISDYLCTLSNSFIAVVVDCSGKWECSGFISGAPNLLIKGPDNALWLTSQWQIEATYPALYRSADGIKWKEVVLPEDRDVDCCFEWLSGICFYNRKIILNFHGDTSKKTKYWTACIHDILNPKPIWHEIDKVDKSIKERCSSIHAAKGKWVRTPSENGLQFLFQLKANQKNITIIIPKSSKNY